MSFSIDYHAETAEDALALVEEQYAPDCVKEFLRLSIKPFLGKPEPVHVHAYGHLTNGQDYDVSTADISVKQLKYYYRKPKPKTNELDTPDNG